MASVEVVLGDTVQCDGEVLPQNIAEYFFYVRPVDTVHGVVDHGKVGAIQQPSDGREIKNRFQQLDVSFGGINYFNIDFGAAVVRHDLGVARSANVNAGEFLTNLVGLNRRCVGVNFIRHPLRSGLTMFAVVLDTKIFRWATGIVTSRQNKGSKCLLPTRAAFPNDRRNGGCRQEAVLSNPETSDAVSNTHLNKYLDCFRVEVATITTNYQGPLRYVRTTGLDGVKSSLYKIVKVVFLLEFGNLLPES
mmetsp:Transcript_96337/g.257643  ORF Transcript_96337/g.257643 Transcript_96337/m.257643 type:complete len:248 (+) Transcript_96337:1099-1842(+)